MNIMIVTNSAYLEPTYIMLYSLFVNHEEESIDVYLPYEDLSDVELAELGTFCKSFSGKQLHPLYVGTKFKENVESRNGINVETYYRILGIDLLPEELERILYLDVDMVITGSLRQLYATDLTNKAFAVCEDIFGIINGFHEANKKRIGIPDGYSYFNAGVMLLHLDYLRETGAAKQMLHNIYENYERYEYNDQDVMNEMYYDKLAFVGWDEYNCPPAWYYLNKDAMAAGKLEFAGYSAIEKLTQNEEEFVRKYQNVTKQIYENAKIVHYLADTKPWRDTRKAARIYDIFDQAYYQYAAALKEYRD